MRNGPYIAHYAASACAGNRRRHFAMPDPIQSRLGSKAVVCESVTDTRLSAYNALDFLPMNSPIFVSQSLSSTNTMSGRNLTAPTLTSVRPDLLVSLTLADVVLTLIPEHRRRMPSEVWRGHAKVVAIS